MRYENRNRPPPDAVVKTSGPDRTAAGLSLLWCWTITVAAPFYYEDQYFNILQAKARFCHITLGVFLTGMVVLILRDAARRTLPKPRPEPLDVVLALFAALSLLSCACSRYPRESFWGMEGWGVGGCAMAGLSAACILLSRTLRLRRRYCLPVLAANLAVFVLTVLHAARVDVLGLHRDILPRQWFNYLSTIGNRNWYVGYLCLLVPVALVWYLSARRPGELAACVLFLAPACLCMVLCSSDSIYLGVGLCAFFAVPYILADEVRMTRACGLLAWYGCCLLLLRLAPPFAELAGRTRGLCLILIRPYVAGAVVAAGLLGMLITRLLYGKLSPRLRRRLTILLELALLAAALAFLVHTILHFSDKWGTNRGRTWRVSLELYRGFPLRQKLLGVGPELLGAYYIDLSGAFSRNILSAHSVPLQLLLTNGALGLGCWLTGWGLLIRQYFKHRLWSREELAFFLPLVACLGQGLVNGPQPLNTALLCLITSCFRSELRSGMECPSGLK